VDELGLSEAALAAEEVVLLPAVELDVRLVELVLLLVEDEFWPIDEGVKELELLASTMAAATVFPVPFPPVIVKKVEKIGLLGSALGMKRMAYCVVGDKVGSGVKVKAWATLGFDTPPSR
jgi:hypothetical protein